ncbi:MAG TPA: hypothetical protein VKG45_00865 [Actinomycetes bacterium]|nr:hypothetical protein [Actinomycetes bacterium]
MTQIVWISGPEALVQGLLDVDGLHVAIHSARTLPGGDRRVTAYASDPAVVQVQQRGLTVEVVVDAATLDAQLETLFGQIERAPGEQIPQDPL